MDLLQNLQSMCRVCAINIKRRSCSGAIPIFGTAQLSEKLKRYLYMEIELDDDLPKSICINCFKRLERVHSLAMLAKKTERFLTDFIESSIKNKTLEDAQQMSRSFANEFASFALNEKQPANWVNLPLENKSGEVVLQVPLNEAFIQTCQTTRPIETNIKLNNRQKRESLQKPNNLEQKRKNLKMVLVNNNAQSTTNSASVAPVTNNLNLIPNVISPTLPASTVIYSQDSVINIQQHQQQQLPQLQQQQQPQSIHQQENTISATTESVVYDCLNLGCVIKDLDLLKLILKALKWSYNSYTLDAQISRLKNTRFRDVMLDKNLLQDDDLMQILSTYLSPILLQSQTANQSVLPTVVSYKIPADTSVHLVSVPSDEVNHQLQQEQQHQDQIIRAYDDAARQYNASLQLQSNAYSKTNKIKRPYIRRKQRPIIQYRSSSPIEILSDDSDDIQMFEVSIDPTLYFPQDTENSNESLVSLAHKQRQKEIQAANNKARRKQKRKQAHVQINRDKETIEQQIVIEDTIESVVQQQQLPIPVVLETTEKEKQEPVPSIINTEINYREEVQRVPIPEPSPSTEPLPPPPPLVERPKFDAKEIVQKNDIPTIDIEDNSNDDAVWAEFKPIPIVVEIIQEEEPDPPITNTELNDIEEVPRLPTPVPLPTPPPLVERPKFTTKEIIHKNNIPTTTIDVDEISNDDAVWAEFKVTDSPDHIFIAEENVENNAIKVELDDTPTEQDNSEITPSDDVTIATEVEEELIKPAQEELSTIDILSNHSIKEENDPDQTSAGEEQIEVLKIITCVPKKRGRKKRDNPIADTNPDNGSAPSEVASSTQINPSSLKEGDVVPVKKKFVIPETRASKRLSKAIVQALVAPSAAEEKNLKEAKQAKKLEPERRSLRNARKDVNETTRKPEIMRKRICKQCGLTFDKLMDFIMHRKKHTS